MSYIMGYYIHGMCVCLTDLTCLLWFVKKWGHPWRLKWPWTGIYPIVGHPQFQEVLQRIDKDQKVVVPKIGEICKTLQLATSVDALFEGFFKAPHIGEHKQRSTTVDFEMMEILTMEWMLRKGSPTGGCASAHFSLTRQSSCWHSFTMPSCCHCTVRFINSVDNPPWSVTIGVKVD